MKLKEMISKLTFSKKKMVKKRRQKEYALFTIKTE